MERNRPQNSDPPTTADLLTSHTPSYLFPFDFQGSHFKLLQIQEFE